MKAITAILLTVFSVSAMAGGHDYHPNPRYDSAFKLDMSGVQWQTWAGNVGLNYEGSGVPAEFPEFIYMVLGQAEQTIRCEYKFAAKLNPVDSAMVRATNHSNHQYDFFYSVNCPNEHYSPTTVVSVGTETDRVFIYPGEITRNVLAVQIQAAWEAMKSRYFSDASGSAGCTRLHGAISEYRRDNQSLEEYCF